MRSIRVLALVLLSLAVGAGGCDKPEEPKRDAASAPAPSGKDSSKDKGAAPKDAPSAGSAVTVSGSDASAAAPLVDGAAPNDPDPDEEEADKDDDTSAAGLERRVKRLAKSLLRANNRLDRITQTFVNPPDPSKPPIRTALGETKTKAQALILKADDLLGKLGDNPQDPSPNLTDQDPDKDTDTSGKGLVRRINRLNALLGRTDSRFDKILRTFVNPPDPSKPPIRAAVADVKTRAQQLITKADALLKKVN
jgi:hypothetical protein